MKSMYQEDYFKILFRREKEEQRMERQSNPKGSVTVNINASELFTTYDPDKDDELYYDSK